MKKSCLLIVSSLLLISGCSSTGTKMTEEAYDSFVNELKTSNFTLKLETSYTKDTRKDWNNYQGLISKYQFDFANDCYAYIKPEDPYYDYCVWVPNETATDKYVYYFCPRNTKSLGSWAPLTAYESVSFVYILTPGWFSSFSDLSYDSKENCYYQNFEDYYWYCKNDLAVYYYFQGNKITEIARKQTSSSADQNWYEKRKITNIGTTVIDRPTDMTNVFERTE